jgi:hypothetical protein
MHVTSADRTYEDFVATAAQSKNYKDRSPLGGLADCTHSLLHSRMGFVRQDGDWSIKHAFNELGGQTVFLNLLEVATVSIEA